MSTIGVATSRERVVSWPERLSLYIELTKPRIAMLVLMTVAVAALLASWGQPNPAVMAWTVLGTALVAGSASVWNQWLERDRDALMKRTARRPIPAGLIRPHEAVALSLVMLLAGLVLLTTLANLAAAGLGLLTWLLYTGLYTPLKTLTGWNTAVGAVAGAMPVAIGWTACGGRPGFAALALFATVFFWQFPHFMAIAWLYREDYARAGYRMWPVVDRSGRTAGVQAVLGAVSLLPTTVLLMMMLTDFMSTAAAAAALVSVFVLGLMQLGTAVVFLSHPGDRTARWMLRTSLLYLPILLTVLAGGPLL